ncbi:MAG: universal stress protein [Prochloraceae cyanobacterium]
MWEKILVPVDSSPAAENIFESALSLAKLTGGSLILLHVFSMDEEDAPPPPTFTGQYTRNRVTGEYDTKESIIEKRQKQWEIFEQKRLKFLKKMKDRASEQNVNTEIVRVFGNPGPVICQRSQEYGVDLIIMGNRGISTIEKIVLGSVSSYVVQNAFCSVLIARIPEQKEISIKWEKILVALDSSPIAKTVFDRALSLAKSVESNLTLLQVLSMDDLNALKAVKNDSLEIMKKGGLESFNEALETIKNEAIEAIKDPSLKAMESEALKQNVSTETIQVMGSPGRTICEQAELLEIDLIAIGNRGLSGLQKLILGSVSSYVINNSSRSILVARTASEE